MVSPVPTHVLFGCTQVAGFDSLKGLTHCMTEVTASISFSSFEVFWPFRFSGSREWDDDPKVEQGLSFFFCVDLFYYGLNGVTLGKTILFCF